MANKTLKQIRQLVEANNPEIVGSELFTEPFLNELINNAQLDVQMNLSGLALDRFKTNVNLTIDDGDISQIFYSGIPVSRLKMSLLVNRLTRPNSIIDIQTINTVALPTAGNATVYGVAKEIDRTKFFDVIRNPYGSDYAKPVFIIYGYDASGAGEFIYLYPQLSVASVDDDELSQTVNYYRRCTPLTTDATVLEIPEEYEHFVIKRVNIDVQSALGQLQKKDEAIQELMLKLQKSQEDFVASLSPLNSTEIAPIGEGARLQ